MVAFPLVPVPSYYSRVLSPNRNGVWYEGDSPIIVELQQATPNHYQVRDWYGNIILDEDIPGATLPALSATNDLALGAAHWFSGSATADSGAAFDPGGAGTNHHGRTTWALSFHTSSSSLQLSSDVGLSFGTILPGDAGWSATLACILSAPAQTAAVVQAVTGTGSGSVDDHITQAVSATSTSNLLVCLIGCTNDVVTSVTDSAGNTWVRQSGPEETTPGLGDSYVYTTTAANPSSITSVTVNLSSASTSNLMSFQFYEISGAVNIDPIDLSVHRNGYGSFASANQAAPGTSLPLPTPVGGWRNGWYRIYFTGTQTGDATFGDSYGAGNFCIIRNDSRFIPMPSKATVGTGAGREDRIMKGVLGIGASRVEIDNAADPDAGGNLTSALARMTEGAAYWSDMPSQYMDPDRPERHQIATFANGAIDRVELQGNGAPGIQWLYAYLADPGLDGNLVFVSSGPGTMTGSRVIVYYPDAVTQVEDYDNLFDNHAAEDAINGVSAYISVLFGPDNNASTSLLTPAAVGDAKRLGVELVVNTLYPIVTRFEGPRNEPPLNKLAAIEMRLFYSYVKAAEPNAIVIGPCPVDIFVGVGWQVFLINGGLDWIDELDFHDYSTIPNGELNVGRDNIQSFRDFLINNGYGSLPMWQTEAGEAFTSTYGIYHPRRARVGLIHRLLWEQFDLPRERNMVWYDISHGFWAFPTWLETSDGSLNPQAILYRVLSEETFGQSHDSIMDFGLIGNNIFLGSIYASPAAESTAVILSTSYMLDASVTLAITGTTDPIEVVDGFGNLTTYTQTSGRITIPIFEIPTYVRLPTGVACSVYSCNDWPPNYVNNQGVSSAWLAVTATAGGVNNPGLNDGEFTYNPTDWLHGIATPEAPDAVILEWDNATRVDRVIIWNGPAYSLAATLLDFDIDTSPDGSTWTTRATFTDTSAVSFKHGTDSFNAGCQLETYWNEQWIFDIKLPEPVICKAIRINVRSCSYGGEPDLEASAMGQPGDPFIIIQEIRVLCDDNVKPQYVIAT